MALTTPSAPFASRFRDASGDVPSGEARPLSGYLRASEGFTIDGLKGYQGHNQQSFSR
jgi:hypothetical protein